MSLIRLVLFSCTLALCACSGPHEKPAEGPGPTKPDAAFLALSVREQNLAVYDAFWKQIDSNYYEPNAFATAEWRAKRAQWREQAANAGGMPFVLYNDVLRKIAQEMPESHFGAEYPMGRYANQKLLERTPEEERKFEELSERFARLRPLMDVGAGLATAEVRRGKRVIKLVSDVWPGTLADEHDIRPGWGVVNVLTSLQTEDNAVHFTGDFVPLDAAAARKWERGEAPETPPDPATVVHVRYDLRMGEIRPLVETRELAGGVRYLRFNGFGDDPFMKSVFAELGHENPNGLILDLRWNEGGITEQVQKVAAVLLGSDALLGTMQERGGISETRATKAEERYTGPLAVLIGPNSASGAEILAAAVQDHNRGRLIGRMTNGSVLTAKYFPLPDTGLVKVPISNYYRVDGKRIEGAGVEPDIWILPALEEVRAKRDPALERALLELKK